MKFQILALYHGVMVCKYVIQVSVLHVETYRLHEVIFLPPNNRKIKQVTSLCRGSSNALALDVGLVLQGEQEGELPESVLGALRIERLDLQNASRWKPLWED